MTLAMQLDELFDLRVRTEEIASVRRAPATHVATLETELSE
jgi:hypothetical protein